MPTELHSSQRQLYKPEIQKIEIVLDLFVYTVSPILSSEVRNSKKKRTPAGNSEIWNNAGIFDDFPAKLAADIVRIFGL
mgnify:CR=1 FL=1